jgi:hypothetical protein
MVALNRVQLIGNLGKDPEQKTVGDGKLVTFSMAMTDAWTKPRYRRAPGTHRMGQHRDLECCSRRSGNGFPQEGFPRLR